ncbi:glycosyltransferase [Actinomadura livida]|uniref:Glycosyltransferase n=1 Tax=Actinomadura livida TaxID=79909 RepID=A0A7W7I835_9ACTN|nr:MULTISPECIES: glycosyltransferase [Actinomadura]MBB4772257.1 glycosyltransferase involved in cell wall biosynthesis [Actinomadura catellatispora]GGU27996.1 glycosyl transferase [Actinomadura livida]
MTRVLHVITGLEHGGAERQLVLLLRHLPVACEVATLTRTGTLGAQLRAAGVPVHEIGMRHNRDLAALPRLARLIRRGRYDVVHTHLYRACVYGRIAARMAGTPRIVATEHSLGDGHIEGRVPSRGVRILYRATERLGSATVAVSPTVAARLCGWGVRPGRIVVIPNAIDAAGFAFDAARRAATRRRLGIAPDERIVGAVGRLVPTKRFDLLVEAVAPLRGVRLLLVGTGPERARLERLARDLGATGRVLFAGGTSDVAGALAAMDVLAAPSVQESFGLAVLEGLAAGLPVLYTTCPALDDRPPGEAPQARRLPTDARIWSAELERVTRGPRERTPVPPVVARYAIAEQAARLARLYEDGLTTVSEPSFREGAPTRERAHDAAT